MLNGFRCRILSAFLLLFGSAVIAHAQMPGVHEVSMAAPDIVHVELRDPAFRRGSIVVLDRPRPEPNGTWVRHGNTMGLVIGPGRDRLRLADAPPEAFLDREIADDVQGYGPVGGRKVVAVHRKSMPYDAGVFPAPNGDTRSGASFRHDIYLKLDGPLPQGSHLISWPSEFLPPTAFDFDDRTIRASSIHATQNGHRRADLSKIAYLSLWLPGADRQGAVDFRDYGIGDFEVVDGTGSRVFSGPVRLRADPQAAEPGNGLGSELVEYTDAAATRALLASLRDGVFTSAQPHGFETGERIALERLGGDQDASALFATVTAITPISFGVTDASGEIPGRLEAGSTAARAHRANRAGTFVFELDYSAWIPDRNGTYRLRIPGIGVSDPVIVADDVWERAGVTSLAGLYHHRSGIPLDGRFGYSRPAAFRPGPDMAIRETRLPLVWTSEFWGGFVPFEEGGRQGWITDRIAPDSYWGGYMDAGDWDRRIQHVDVSSLLLEIVESTPDDGQLRRADLPKSSEFLEDPVYRTLDDLPDLVHEAIWVLDFFRRLQMPDGSIRGGIESAGHPLRGESSFLEHQTVFAYAPDHVSSYRYAAVAAKLARVLRRFGAEDAAALFAESAQAAWAAGERGFADPDGYYADALEAAKTTGVFADVPWEERRRALLEQTVEYRVAAAAALLRLTDDASYASMVEEWWRMQPDLHAYKGDAAWDYMHSAARAEAVAEEMRAAFLREARVVVDAQKHFAYPGLKHPAAPAGWGQGGAPGYSELQILMRAHRIGGDPEILRAMEQAHHVMLGANQLGLSLVTGIGVRAVGNPLHEDRLAMGVEPPSGITIYGWASQAQTAHGWIFGPPWSPLPEVGTAEHARQRRIDPPRFSLPYFEYLVEHPALVMQQEYTVQQTIGTMAALALYLDAH